MINVSIIIPTYNHEHYLTESIQSALDQTVPCEIIVIDDGSTDGSLNVAKTFPVKVIHQVNKGLASARNTGIMNATGDYILPLDSDDLLKENCVERIIEVIEQTNADIVAPSFKCFGTQNHDVIIYPTPTLQDFLTANRIAYCAAMKKSVLVEVGGYSPRMTWGYEDYALWIDLLERGKTLAVIPETLFMYRTKDVSMITEALKHHDELIAQIIHDHPKLYA